MQEIMSIDLSHFPEPLRTILKVAQVKGALAAPAAFRSALAWVWDTQKSYTPTYILEEFKGMGEGLCAAVRIPHCNSTAHSESIAQLNMLPELLRMKCTAYGAWGKATSDNQLVQLRALDFGGGPFANYTVAAVYRDAQPTEQSNAFVSITFPGSAGAITGVSQRGIGLSQKVWTVYDGRGYLPGTFEGETCVFVLRNILQKAMSRSAALASALLTEYSVELTLLFVTGWRRRSTCSRCRARGPSGSASATTRPASSTWSAIRSPPRWCTNTMPSMTGQPYLESVVYVDKHQQV